jgi:hypothetical protein
VVSPFARRILGNGKPIFGEETAEKMLKNNFFELRAARF